MGVRGFRPSGRVPFAAMQKEPKNRWGTARGTSGFALRPNGLTPRPRYGVQRPCVGRTLQNLIRRTLPVQLRNSGRFTGDTLYPHHDNPQNLFPLRLTAVARRGRRCGLPLNQAAHNGAEQPGQAPRRTIGNRRRGKTVADTSCFLTAQGLGGPEGETAKSGLARRTQGTRPQ